MTVVFPRLRRFAALLLLVASCTTPGYYVRLESQGHVADAAALLTRLGEIADKHHFALVRQNVRLPPEEGKLPEQYTFFHKSLSGASDEVIHLYFIYSISAGSMEGVRIDVRNPELRSKTSGKAEVDAVADELLRELVTTFGERNVMVCRKVYDKSIFLD